MIQLNLLPDVKLEYLHAQNIRRLVISISTIIAGAALAIFIILYSLTTYQRLHLNSVNSDVATDTAKLQNEPQIKQILTVQNQLQTVTGLLNNEPQANKLLGFINQITPAKISINSLTVGFGASAGGASTSSGTNSANSVNVAGAADSLATVNAYVDTLKFTDIVSSKGVDTKTPAFNSVVLSSFSYNSTATNQNQKVSYTINFNFNPTIFNLTANQSLTIPSEYSTRSILDQPNNGLFQAAPGTSSTGTTTNTTGSKQ